MVQERLLSLKATASTSLVAKLPPMVLISSKAFLSLVSTPDKVLISSPILPSKTSWVALLVGMPQLLMV